MQQRIERSPSWVQQTLFGLGGLLNFSGTYYQRNYRVFTAATDQQALYDDWFLIGRDLHKACQKADQRILNGRN